MIRRAWKPRRPAVVLSAMTRQTIVGIALLAATVAAAQGPPCAPCAGLAVDDPSEMIPALASGPPLAEGARLYLRWPAALDGTADAALAGLVAEVGAVPWLVLRFDVPSPVADHADALVAQLEEAARLARAAPPNAHFEIVWSGDAATSDGVRDVAFVLKRASVTVTGARPGARVIAGGLPIDDALLAELYAADVAAYLDGVEVGERVGDRLAAAAFSVGDVDPGRPIVHSAGEFPDDPWLALPYEDL